MEEIGFVRRCPHRKNTTCADGYDYHGTWDPADFRKNALCHHWDSNLYRCDLDLDDVSLGSYMKKHGKGFHVGKTG